MILKINNKEFVGRYNESGILTIQLYDENDIFFFKGWENKRYNSSKSEYVEDIDLYKITENIVLKNCFPKLSKNEDSVELYYDSYYLCNPIPNIDTLNNNNNNNNQQ